MSSVSVQIVVFSCDPTNEITINMRGDTTLGSLRDVIHSCIGGGPNIDRAWVAFEDESKGVIPFGHKETTSDALQLRFLRCSDRQDSHVAVGVFRYSVPVEEEESSVQQNGQGAKRAAADDTDCFARSGYARV